GMSRHPRLREDRAAPCNPSAPGPRGRRVRVWTVAVHSWVAPPRQLTPAPVPYSGVDFGHQFIEKGHRWNLGKGRRPLGDTDKASPKTDASRVRRATGPTDSAGDPRIRRCLTPATPPSAGPRRTRCPTRPWSDLWWRCRARPPP